MLFEKFKATASSFYRDFFKVLAQADAEGKLEREILYPTMLLFTDCNGYYLAEMMGASRKYIGLTLKTHKEKSIDTYLTQHEAKGDIKSTGVFNFNGSRNIIDYVTIINADIEEATRRFPALERQGTVVHTKIADRLLSFGPDFRALSVQHCVLVNKGELSIRSKFILNLGIFASNISKRELLSELDHHTANSRAFGAYVIVDNQDQYAERLIVGGQFQSAFLINGLRETTIGDFIKAHPEIIKKAFNTDHFIYEPLLEWKEHDDTCEDASINPDLLIRRADGNYDICDLKTALLDKTSLTTAERRRRQFIHTVRDGIAQLANYREYFEYPENAKHAFEKYKVKVSNPKLTLIVGNFENFDPAEVSQAGRIVPDIEIIDYDTLCHLFMGVSPAPTEEPVSAPGD